MDRFRINKGFFRVRRIALPYGAAGVGRGGAFGVMALPSGQKSGLDSKNVYRRENLLVMLVMLVRTMFLKGEIITSRKILLVMFVVFIGYV